MAVSSAAQLLRLPISQASSQQPLSSERTDFQIEVAAVTVHMVGLKTKPLPRTVAVF
jgi:hypothetical protein